MLPALMHLLKPERSRPVTGGSFFIHLLWLVPKPHRAAPHKLQRVLQAVRQWGELTAYFAETTFLAVTSGTSSNSGAGT